MARWFSSGIRCSWRKLVNFCLLCYILFAMYSFIVSVLEEAEKLNRARFRNIGSIQLQERDQETGRARVEFVGVACYSSRNLWERTYEGIVLAAEENKMHDLHKMNVVERPRVIFNNETQKYVMWMHIDDSTYEKGSAGVAVSDFPAKTLIHTWLVFIVILKVHTFTILFLCTRFIDS